MGEDQSSRSLTRIMITSKYCRYNYYQKLTQWEDVYDHFRKSQSLAYNKLLIFNILPASW